MPLRGLPQAALRMSTEAVVSVPPGAHVVVDRRLSLVDLGLGPLPPTWQLASSQRVMTREDKRVQEQMASWSLYLVLKVPPSRLLFSVG